MKALKEYDNIRTNLYVPLRLFAFFVVELTQLCYATVQVFFFALVNC